MLFTDLIGLELPNLVREKIDFFSGIDLRCLKNKKNLWGNQKFFEINIKPNHPFSKPLLGEIQRTSNFLVKINKKRSTNLVKDGTIFIKINKTIKIRNFADFLYLPFCENLISKNIKPRQEVGKSLKKLSYKNQFNQSFPIDFLLPLNSGCLKYQKHFILEEKKKMKRKKGKNFKTNQSFFDRPVIPLGIDQRSFGEISLESEFFSGLREKESLMIPKEDIKKVLKLVPSFILGFFLKLFKKRPIWNLKSINKYCQPFLRRYVKKILPLLSYKFRVIGGLKDSWARFNYNPRKDIKFLVYRPKNSYEKNIFLHTANR